MSTVPALNIDHPNPRLDVADDLTDRIRQLADDLEAERARLDEVMSELGRTERELAAAERDKVVAEARAEEQSRRVDDERRERQRIEFRIEIVKADRDLALAAMGWWSRTRYKRRRKKHTDQIRNSIRSR